MSGPSVVFYRFKAQKEASTVQFEGTGISVWDLKKEILAENKLGKGADFDFAIYNADTNDEYSDDKTIVPRNTSVIARRLPPSKPGRGNAQFYMVSSSNQPATSYASSSSSLAAAGAKRGHVTKRFDGKEDAPAKPSASTQQPIVAPTGATADEASNLAAFFGNTDQQWKTTQEKLSTSTPVYGFGRGRGAGPGKPQNNSVAPDKPVPAGYVCYRCGQPGHWIQDCPTNDKAEFDNKPRIKRTTGIPKSFLQAVDAPAKDGDSHQTGLMVTADGGFVIARPDAASWEKHRAIQANLTQKDVESLPPTDPDLTCTLCNRLLRDAVKTPCCQTAYCEECIQNYLSENDFVCPECESKIKSLKQLVKDEDRRKRAKQYLEDTLKASKAAGEKEKQEKDGAHGDTGSQAGDSVKQEDQGPAEEGEVGADDQSTGSRRRSQSPGSTRAQSVKSDDGARSRQRSAQPGNNGNMQNTSGANGMSGFQTMFNGMNGGALPPQVQMLQNQIMQTMNMLQSPSLPPPMRMNLMGQLQALQFQYGQAANMLQMNGFFNGGGGSPYMQQQMMMHMSQMQQMQQMQQMLMMQQQQQFQANQQNFGNRQSMPFQNSVKARYGMQYEEDSADSPYMRVPVNPKFKQGLKRDRPEDFVEIAQPVKR